MVPKKTKKVEFEVPSDPASPAGAHSPPNSVSTRQPPSPKHHARIKEKEEQYEEARSNVGQKKSVMIPVSDKKVDYAVAESSPIARNSAGSPITRNSVGSRSVDRDVVLKQVISEKRLSLSKAWEESEKKKADNKPSKKMVSWEISQQAAIEVTTLKKGKKVGFEVPSDQPALPVYTPPGAAYAPYNSVSTRLPTSPKHLARIKEKEEQHEEARNNVGLKKSVILVSDKKVDSAVAENTTIARNSSRFDRDVVLKQVLSQKRFSLIRAWEESEKKKTDNKANKKMSFLESWEISQQAAIEADLRKIQEKLEIRKAEYAEKMKNRIAEIHKAAEERRATVEASRKQERLKLEDMAAKFRATGYPPKKLLGCFSI